SNEATFTFAYKETPVITNNTLTQVICSGGTTQEVVINSTIADPDYDWEVIVNGDVSGYIEIDSGSVIPEMTLINENNTSGFVTYIVTPSYDGCTGDPVSFTFVVNPIPQIPNDDVFICSGNTFEYTPLNNPPEVIAPANTTYTWTVIPNPNIMGAADE